MRSSEVVAEDGIGRTREGLNFGDIFFESIFCMSLRAAQFDVFTASPYATPHSYLLSPSTTVSTSGESSPGYTLVLKSAHTDLHALRTLGSIAYIKQIISLSTMH